MADNNQEQEYDDDSIEVYKKWFRGRDGGGFLSVRLWPDADRIIVDIGTVRNEALVSSAKCYIEADQFAVYLEAEVNGDLTRYYPDFFSEEAAKAGHAWYGGTTKGGPPIARVFKTTPWQNSRYDRAFKCLWCEGEPQAGGAIKPIYQKVLRNEMIKVTAHDLALILENLRKTQMTTAVSKKTAE